MSKEKEIQKLVCNGCDSEFKLIFNREDVSSNPKFCPFCADELFFEELLEENWDVEGLEDEFED